MANVLVQESSLQDIADAIRSKNGTQNTYKPAQMADAIEAISGGGITPTGTIQITANGTHNVTNYASAEVNVPTGTTPTGTKQISITQNGTTTENVTDYASAEITVNVPSSSPSLGTKTITANGTYTASSESLDGYSSVVVSVSGGSGSVTGTFSVENDTTSAVTITTLTEIGFTPSMFIMYEPTKQTESTTQYGICNTARLQIGDCYIRTYERYSNTSGSVAAGCVATDWTANQSGYLRLSGDNINYVASSTCILLGGVTYNWIAIP